MTERFDHRIEVYANSKPASRDLKEGDVVTLYNADGSEVEARVTAITKQDGEARYSFVVTGSNRPL